ncbi:MAG: AMP-binding protein [Reyranella sp.]|jgi:long-chain acyl-CoA synthetase|uniref:AMP-binding protein n=1 Tax=Reyranella sp. TaxID=1929291 RepID=UPI0025E54F21|nr:AMP-binding protein [Reyranella sp.]MBR2816090.1 AMP-binding protein [Reyranella sp.]
MTADKALAEYARLDTFPKRLAELARARGDQPAYREKEYGIWQTYRWARVAAEVRLLAAGLADLGFGRGDRLIVVGDNRPRLYWAMCAAQSLGGVPVPVYQDSVADELAYVVEHAGARYALAENQEQVDKLQEIQKKVPSLQTIFYVDPRGMRHYEGLLSYAEVQARGEKCLASAPETVSAEVAKGKGGDDAIMLYTSGTTGRPKGAVLSYDNLVWAAEAGAAFDGLRAGDELLSYLPMAWVGDHIFSYAQGYVVGLVVNCPESASTVMTDLREIGPTYYFAPPRVLENLITQVTIRMEDAGLVKRRLFQFFMAVARRVGPARLDGRAVSIGDRLLYALGDLLIYGPLKNTLGMSRVRVAYTAGEAVGPEIFNFFRALGVNMKQLYGQTEASVFVTIHPNGEVFSDTVGKPVSNVELRIAESGEVLYRSPGVFKEYFKNPEATNDTKTADGWVHTGDAGYLDERGHLRIIDRARDVGKLLDGTLFAPKYIENKLKFFAHINEAVAFGDGRDFVTAFVNIDMTAVGDWAERRNIAYASYQELAGRPEVYDLIQSEIEQVNRDLAADPRMAGAQIRRFLILHKALDADDGELTRTNKVRRSFIGERYKPLIDALYGGARTAHIGVDVTFEDGRKGRIEGDVAIRDLTPQLALRKTG